MLDTTELKLYNSLQTLILIRISLTSQLIFHVNALDKKLSPRLFLNIVFFWLRRIDWQFHTDGPISRHFHGNLWQIYITSCTVDGRNSWYERLNSPFVGLLSFNCFLMAIGASGGDVGRPRRGARDPRREGRRAAKIDRGEKGGGIVRSGRGSRWMGDVVGNGRDEIEGLLLGGRQSGDSPLGEEND